MAIATLQGHVQRAIDFYNKAGKFFVLGGTQSWGEDDASPTSPSAEDYKLLDIIGYKKVDNCNLVVPVTDDEISIYNYTNLKEYRTQKWRVVTPPFKTAVSSSGVPARSQVIPVNSLAGMNIGSKVRIGYLYEGVITSINTSTNQITITTEAPENIPSGSVVESGALVEGAKYVYVDCSLNYDQFPVNVTYRQIGLCTEVTPNQDILRAADYAGGSDEFTSRGILEVLDNRAPSTRDIDQRELLSLILEF